MVEGSVLRAVGEGKKEEEGMRCRNDAEMSREGERETLQDGELPHLSRG